MTTQPESPADQPLGTLEYEFTDDLAFRAAWAHFDHLAHGVKEDIVREGMPHPALPIVLASVMLVIGLAASAIVAWDFYLTPYLFVAGCLVLLWLLFKAALYFCPPFARWYIRKMARRMVRRLSSRTIRWTFFEDRLETKSANTQRNMAWTELKRLDVLPEFWCLHWKSRLQLIVPATALPAELQALILRKACQVGAAGAVVSPGAADRITE
jgi:hypothetical protein